MARTPRKEGTGGAISLITAALRELPELDPEAGGWQGLRACVGGKGTEILPWGVNSLEAHSTHIPS